jgi:uncharacterized protein YxjI
MTSPALFTSNTFVVSQKVKVIELTNEYSVLDETGQPLATVVEIGQSGLKKALRLVSSVDQFLTHRLEVRDVDGSPILHITRPAKFLKSKVVVSRPDGSEIGRIEQENAIGKIRFAMRVGGQQIGELAAENWRAWDFAIIDETGTEIARIKKTFEGIAKTLFTTADNYVVRIHKTLTDPLLSLVVASALTVDTALKQDNRGLN